MRPQAINRSVSESAFPDEARRWGTSGYASIGYDITPDGVPTNVRTVIASPPFIFGPATEKAVARFRFQPVFRPGNTVGCSGSVQTVTFRMAQ